MKTVFAGVYQQLFQFIREVKTTHIHQQLFGTVVFQQVRESSLYRVVKVVSG